MKRTRREWGMVVLGFAVGFMLGEVRQAFQPNAVVAWVLGALTLGALTLACLVAGFYLLR